MAKTSSALRSYRAFLMLGGFVLVTATHYGGKKFSFR